MLIYVYNILKDLHKKYFKMIFLVITFFFLKSFLSNEDVIFTIFKITIRITFSYNIGCTFPKEFNYNDLLYPTVDVNEIYILIYMHTFND